MGWREPPPHSLTKYPRVILSVTDTLLRVSDTSWESNSKPRMFYHDPHLGDGESKAVILLPGLFQCVGSCQWTQDPNLSVSGLSLFTCKTTFQGCCEVESWRKCSRNGSSYCHSFFALWNEDLRPLLDPHPSANIALWRWRLPGAPERCQKQNGVKSICHLGPMMSAPCSQKRSHAWDANQKQNMTEKQRMSPNGIMQTETIVAQINKKPLKATDELDCRDAPILEKENKMDQ